MRGYLTTDGNYNGHTARAASSDAARYTKTNGAGRGNKTQKAGIYGTVNVSAAGSRAQFSEEAYSLPKRFDRLAYIVSQDDVSSWMNQEQNAAGEQSEQYLGKENSRNYYSTAGERQMSQTAKNDKKAADDEAALIVAEEEKKKEEKEAKEAGKKGFGIWGIDSEQMDSILESMRKAREKYNKNKKDAVKKNLNYEHQRISGTISRAKNLTQAGNAVLKAKSALVSIRRKNATGQYDTNEVAIATNHARKMVRIAKRKLSHIKQEELEDKRQLKSEIEKRRNKKRKVAHRREENMKLMAADLAYIKHKIENMKNKSSDASKEANASGASMSPMEAMQVGYTERRESIKETLEWVLEENGETMTGAGAAVAGGVVGASSAADIISSGGAAAPMPSSTFSMKV